ncbi:hypothetical protein ACH4VM_33355 [Streptomyces sp. NPDC020792]|uniref:hypothetical protein n=1 Tax=Streptomyces sp. NPDC020792 TaxID=3365089 RepID=UPI00379A18C1
MGELLTAANEPVQVRIDVTEAAGLGMPAYVSASVYLPDAATLPERPVVCFGFPGGGYSRGYYGFDMPDSAGQGGQAGWHTARGWIFVAVDPLGFGDSTIAPAGTLDYDNIARGTRSTVVHVAELLRRGTLAEGFPSVVDPVLLGLGQSTSGCLTIALQGQHHLFDGIAVLGFSAIHTVVPSRPGTPAIVYPWVLRGTDLLTPRPLNVVALAAAQQQAAEPPVEHPFTWAFRWDDEPAHIVDADMAATAGIAEGPLPPWRSATTPECALYAVAPGTVATEAASIDVPVFVGVGERDVVPDPRMEPFAYRSSRDVTVYVCPRMAHMHNFAHTRFDFWRRMQSWGDGVTARRKTPNGA